MLAIKPEHARRVSLASKVYPKLKSTLGIDSSKLRSTDRLDGDVFCGGRSKNRDLLTFFGFLAESPHGSSSLIQLPLFRRCIKKLTDLIEDELEQVGAEQIRLPTIIPKRLWDKSGRFQRQTDALDHVYNFPDRIGNHLLLAPTFEESVTQLLQNLEPPRATDLPVMFYQTSQKFRFESNPKFGLLRTNEFTMNDLYSFDSNLENAKETYEMISQVYKKIFGRLALNCLQIQNETGGIGGLYSHEFQLPIASGEDLVIQCLSCGYACNHELHKKDTEQSSQDRCSRCNKPDLREIRTLELGHTFLLSDTYTKPMKLLYKGLNGHKSHYEMGCFGLGLSRILGAGIDLFSISPAADNEKSSSAIQLRWPSEVEPFKMGLVGPAKRSKEFNAGADAFEQRILANILQIDQNIDVMVEDRTKEGILKRVLKLKSLGIPYIIVIGQRYLQDVPEVELLRLDASKRNYDQLWLSEQQLYNFIKENL